MKKSKKHICNMLKLYGKKKCPKCGKKLPKLIPHENNNPFA